MALPKLFLDLPIPGALFNSLKPPTTRPTTLTKVVSLKLRLDSGLVNVLDHLPTLKVWLALSTSITCGPIGTSME